MLGERFPQQSLWPWPRLWEWVGSGVAGELGCNRNWAFLQPRPRPGPQWRKLGEAGGRCGGGCSSSRPVSCTPLSGRSPVGSRARGSAVSHVWGAQVQVPVSSGATESLGW